MENLDNLIGKQVTAIGSCGMGKGIKVTGILMKPDIMGEYEVNVTRKSGGTMIYAVYNKTIEEVKEEE